MYNFLFLGHVVLRVVAMSSVFFVFFFNDTATTEIYTLSLHDALPIPGPRWVPAKTVPVPDTVSPQMQKLIAAPLTPRSEEHTSELQSQFHLVCRLLLEKKKILEIFNGTLSCTTI